MQGALASLSTYQGPRNDMITYSVPHGGLSRTGQLPPLLQAAGWERASPAGSVQISCPPHWWQRPSLARHQWVGKAMWIAWGGTWTDPRAGWEHLKGWASKSCTIGHTGQKSGVNSAEATGQAGGNTALSSGNTAPPDVSQMCRKISASGGNNI